MENLGPFDEAMGIGNACNGETLGAKWPDEKKIEIGPLITQWRPFDDVMGKLNWGPWWPDGEIGGPRPLILVKRFNTAPSHSFDLMGLKF